MNKSILALLLIAVASVRSEAVGDEPDPVEPKLEYLEALRDRQLTGLSEALAERLLAQPNLSDSVRSETVLEMAEAISSRGNRIVDAEQRRQQWQKADDMVARFFAERADYPRMALFRYRWAGILLNRSTMTAELAKVLPSDEPLQADAQTMARQALQQMDEVRLLIKQATAQDDFRRDPKSLSLDEWASLHTAADFRTGVVWLAIARIEKEEEALREAAAKTEKFLKPFTTSSGNHAIALESYLALAEAYELAGDVRQARMLLERLNQLEGIPAEFRSRGHLQLSRLLLKQNFVDDALRLLQVPTGQRVAGAEWEINLFEALLRKGAGLRATDADAAQQLQDQALEILDQLEEQYGRYWGRRGEKTLSQYGNLTGDNLRVLKRLANVQRSDGESEKALQSYLRAVQLAKLQKDRDLTAEMQYAAGTLLLELGRNEEAAQLLTDLARGDRGHELAPRSALTAAYALGRSWTSKKTPRTLQRYRESLQTVISWFPDDASTAGEAQWLLGELEETAGNPDKAIAHYRLISPDHSRFPAALSATAGIFHDNLLMSAEKPEAAVQDARVYLQEMLFEANSADSSHRPATAKAVATARYVLAGLLAIAPDPDWQAAQAMLDQLLGPDSALAEGLRGRAWSTLMEVNWKQGRAQELRELITQAPKVFETDLMRLLATLDPLQDRLSPEQRAAQVELVQAACDRLFAGQEALAPNDRVNLRLLLARAYVAQERYKPAQELLERLRAEAPREPRIVELLGICAFRTGDYALSEKYWALLQKGYTRGSIPWLNAVYHLIACAHAQGETERARKTLTATELFYPELGNDDLRLRFTNLKTRINAP